MASTYSDLKIELIATGEQAGTWGSTTNVNLGTAIEEAIVGRANANFPTDGNLTISLSNTNGTQVARNYILNVTSSVSLTATRNLVVPTIDKPYIIENNTSGSQSIVVKTSAGTGVTVPNGKTVMVYANGTNVVAAQDYIPALEVGALTLPAALTETQGGTGETTYTNGQLLIGNAAGGLTKSTLTAGTNVTITNGDGTITIDAAGGGGGGSVTSIASGNGMNFSTITTTGTVTLGTPSNITSSTTNNVTATSHTHALDNSGVSAGSYTSANITVDAKGRVTAASNGSGGSGFTTLSSIIANGGTVNIPAGKTSCKITVVGGGGAGGAGAGSPTLSPQTGGGGGAGGAVVAYFTGFTNSSGVTVSCSAMSTAGTSTATFLGVTLSSTSGGTGGAGSAGGTAGIGGTGGSASTSGTPSSGSITSVTLGGSDGSGGSTTSNGAGGTGAGSILGGAGRGRNGLTNGDAAVSNSGSGGGGGGGNTSGGGSGGTGSAGRIIVEY